MRLSLVIVVLSCFAATLVGGCRGDTRSMAQRPPAQAPLSLHLPADFPEDVALPPRYRVDSVSDLGSLLVTTLITPETVPQLFAESGQRMSAGGWQQSAQIQHATGNAMRVYRKDGREVSLSFASHRRGDGSVVTVQLRDPQRHL